MRVPQQLSGLRSSRNPLDIPQERWHLPLCTLQERALPSPKADILQGTLDLMVLKTLDSMGSMHGYGIARRIEQISEEALQINQGTIYASLVRLMQQRWITGAWGTSDNKRKAKFYSITKAGRKQLDTQERNWERISAVIGRVLNLAERG